jgi:hypothetical protein
MNNTKNVVRSRRRDRKHTYIALGDLEGVLRLLNIKLSRASRRSFEEERSAEGAACFRSIVVPEGDEEGRRA